MDTRDMGPYDQGTSPLESPLESPPLRSPPLRYYAQISNDQDGTPKSDAIEDLQPANTMQPKQPATILDKVKGILHAGKRSA